jgi:hypothetical protein
MLKWSTLLLCLTLLTANAVAANVLVNPGFETNSLPPWFNSNDFCGGCTWAVTSSDANSGAFSAFASGNRLLEQDFAAIPVSMVTEVSLWLNMPDTGIAAIFFLYGDASTEENVVSVGATWTKFDMTSFLNSGQTLAGFGVYGCTNCAGSSLTFADDFVVDTSAAVPEPGTMILLGSGLIAAAGAARRRFL